MCPHCQCASPYIFWWVSRVIGGVKWYNERIMRSKLKTWNFENDLAKYFRTVDRSFNDSFCINARFAVIQLYYYQLPTGLHTKSLQYRLMINF